MKNNRFNFFIHNFFGHPIMGILNLFGFKNLAKTVHDKTLPKQEDTQL